MHLGIALQIVQDQRRHDLARRRRESIDAQRTGRCFLLGACRVHRLLDVFERRLDLCNEDASRIGERDAARGAIEQTNGKLPLKLGHSAADRRGRHAEFESRCSKRTAPNNGQDRLKFNERVARHCPDFRYTPCGFISLIGRKVQR